MECCYCKKTFRTKSSLNHHIKSAQYCLALRGKDITIFRCEFCGRSTSTKYNLIQHYDICQKKRIIRSTNNKDLLITEQKLTIQELEEKLSHVNKEKEKLQDKFDELVFNAVNKPTTINTINNQRYQQVMNLTPLTLEHLTEQSEKHLTIEHIQDGGAGYGRVAADMFSDCTICADFSRKKLVYRTEDGKFVHDPDLNRAAPLFFQAIIDKHDRLAHKFKDDQYRKYGIHDDCTEEEKNAYSNGEKYVIIGKVAEIMHLNNRIKKFAKGEGMNDEVIYEFRKVLCSILTSQQEKEK